MERMRTWDTLSQGVSVITVQNAWEKLRVKYSSFQLPSVTVDRQQL